MHSLVIQLSPVPVDEEHRMTDSDLWDDPTVNHFSDYCGDEADEECQKNGMEELAGLFDASLDLTEKKITFPDKETVLAKLKDWMRRTIAQQLEKAVPDVDCLETYNESDLLIRMDHFVPEMGIHYGTIHTTAQFAQELAAGYIPTTVYVGTIIDYHIG